MKRFTVTTTGSLFTVRGVDWEDGKATYQIKVGSGVYETPVSGAVDDMTFAYGGYPGYTFTYLD